MASFSAGGAYSGAILIGQVFQRDIISAVWYSGLLGVADGKGDIFPKRRAQGDVGSRWVVRRAGPGAALFAEHDVISDYSSSTYASAVVSWTYARGAVQVTGMAKDSMASAVAGGTDVVKTEVMAAAADVATLISQSFMGSVYGIGNAIAATGTYAGIARGAATWWDATVSTTASVAGIRALLTTLRTNPKSGALGRGIWLCPHAVEEWLDNCGASNGMRVINGPDQITARDRMTLGGYAVYAASDLPSGNLIFVDLNNNKLEIDVIRPMSVDFQGRSGDSDLYQISAGGAARCENPGVTCGKVTGIS